MDDQNTHSIFQNISAFRVSIKYSGGGLIPQIKSKLILDICYNSARLTYQRPIPKAVFQSKNIPPFMEIW